MVIAMKWIFNFLIVCLTVSHFAIAGDAVKNGTLQAYWLPIWHDNLNEPKLLLRFASDEKNSATKIINLNEIKAPQDFISKHFSHIPEGFFRYKEGYIEQYGSLRFSQLHSITECDSNIYQATLLSFTAQHITKPFINTGCDNHPWLITMQLKDDIHQAKIHSQPVTGSKTVSVISAQTPLVKIKTINQDWFYVANYDENQPALTGKLSGYIQAELLEPIN